MKKFTLIAAAAMTAMAVNAQYNVDPSTSVVAAENPTSVEYLVLSDGAIAELQATGAKMQYIGPDPDNGRNLWYWDQTFIPADDSYPRVDMEEGGYVAVEVGTVGWSGAGFDCQGDGIDLSTFNDETRFHLAYMTPSGNGPASVALILVDGEGSSPAKVALGTAFDDGGNVYPAIGAALSDEWQGVDISFADLKKMYTSFNPGNNSAWKGNIMSWLGGGVTGQTMAFDAMYFYNVGEAGIEGIASDKLSFIVTNNTINLNGGNGIVLYDLAGKTVKQTSGCVLGINNLPKGVYVAKSGKLVKKVVVR
ncbi:MAG: T9SS type A sorting domain-containing protein [Muribaculaceae bacterium]|nr:T9SS type A sorting domain-containing protein [Muribaculaceae bacterium]